MPSILQAIKIVLFFSAIVCVLIIPFYTTKQLLGGASAAENKYKIRKLQVALLALIVLLFSTDLLFPSASFVMHSESGATQNAVPDKRIPDFDPFHISTILACTGFLLLGIRMAAIHLNFPFRGRDNPKKTNTLRYLVIALWVLSAGCLSAWNYLIK